MELQLKRKWKTKLAGWKPKVHTTQLVDGIEMSIASTPPKFLWAILHFGVKVFDGATSRGGARWRPPKWCLATEAGQHVKQNIFKTSNVPRS